MIVDDRCHSMILTNIIGHYWYCFIYETCPIPCNNKIRVKWLIYKCNKSTTNQLMRIEIETKTYHQHVTTLLLVMDMHQCHNRWQNFFPLLLWHRSVQYANVVELNWNGKDILLELIKQMVIERNCLKDSEMLSVEPNDKIILIKLVCKYLHNWVYGTIQKMCILYIECVCVCV